MIVTYNPTIRVTDDEIRQFRRIFFNGNLPKTTIIVNVPRLMTVPLNNSAIDYFPEPIRHQSPSGSIARSYQRPFFIEFDNMDEQYLHMGLIRRRRQSTAQGLNEFFMFYFINNITRIIPFSCQFKTPKNFTDYCSPCDTSQLVDLILDNASCSICLELFEEIHELVATNFCKHIFHKSCLESWLQENETCPNCRMNLNGASNLIEDEYDTIPDLVEDETFI